MNKKKYTIAQILPALNNGGVERGVVEISKALVDNNFRSIVISSGGYMVPQIIRNGGIHYELDVHAKNPLKWGISNKKTHIVWNFDGFVTSIRSFLTNSLIKEQKKAMMRPSHLKDQ